MSDNKLTRTEIARRNGALSHGPTSPEGKARSSRNAYKHGLTARCFLSSPEEQADFAAHLEAAEAHWNPCNGYQRSLVADLARSEYLHRRAQAIQNALLDVELDARAEEIARIFQSIDPVGLLAFGYQSLHDRSDSFRNLDSHLVRLSRERARLTKLLRAALFRNTGLTREEAGGPLEKLENEPTHSPSEDLCPAA